jgi:hypothetical protein
MNSIVFNHPKAVTREVVVSLNYVVVLNACSSADLNQVIWVNIMRFAAR